MLNKVSLMLVLVTLFLTLSPTLAISTEITQRTEIGPPNGPEGPPENLPHPEVPVGNRPAEPKHHQHPLDPLCFTTGGTYLGVCGILPGVDCRVVSGSVFGGWVKCRHYNFGTGYIGCYIRWPICTFYRFY